MEESYKFEKLENGNVKYVKYGVIEEKEVDYETFEKKYNELKNELQEVQEKLDHYYDEEKRLNRELYPFNEFFNRPDVIFPRDKEEEEELVNDDMNARDEEEGQEDGQEE